MWYPFRQGNRCEYLAQYILSALGLAIKVPREEDIGVDFYCSLANVDGNKMTFYAPFIVQVKSDSENVVRYGGIDEKGKWKKDGIEWLFSQELPLFIAVVSREEQMLNLYPTSNKWAVHYQGMPGEVVLQMNVPSECERYIDAPKPEEKMELRNYGDGKQWNVPLGNPIISISIGDSENEKKLNYYRALLRFFILLEQENITYKRLKVHYSKWPLQVKTNDELNNPFTYGIFWAANTIKGANNSEQLKSLAPIITILALNYKNQGKFEEMEKLKPIVSLFPESAELKVLKDNIPELFKED